MSKLVQFSNAISVESFAIKLENVVYKVIDISVGLKSLRLMLQLHFLTSFRTISIYKYNQNIYKHILTLNDTKVACTIYIAVTVYSRMLTKYSS